MMQPKKRFIEIVQQLRTLIREEHIEEGGKLPSERVLSERLQVGRSAVREALRSLELLGLIETKHGGGTFLSASPQHKLIEVLATFIMDDAGSIEDVHKTRILHEQEAIRVVCTSAELRALPVWESLFIRLEVAEDVVRKDVLREIIITAGNRLSLRIWLQLQAYSGRPLGALITTQEKPYVLTLVKALQLGLTEDALQAHAAWVNNNKDKGVM
ncbi:GntR family transcriptional regulator [Lysinibacillus sp. BF-4]|uniref:FadR/GntR family transcriptional regulator n=1 Tax=Lysinibacillus sp. BF-4 TaxID=1473546 RepID=UPI000502D031|nr:GntR family transcriptional regulator [Lysinibacillus sp. BF-4]KFL44156.1 GntR family transcriptional regulator [Lysinibacillus sp. BF-4]